jgi:predicted glycosyltransferase involved in capsule biosynthesis
MKKILLTMKFWDDGHPNSTRVRNTLFTWPELKKLSVFLNNSDINCESKLYDFSPEQIVEGSIHKPYGLGEYKKSEKTNVILKENSEFDFVFMFDSDAFFLETDYLKILEILKNLVDGDIITFDLAKLEEKDVDGIIQGQTVDFEKTDWSYAYSGNKEFGPLAHGHRGNLGGVYLCDIKLILENGGFDENFIGWGGEDGDMVSRIYSSGMKFNHKSVNNFAPFHLPHFYDWGSEKYNKRFKN